MAFSTSLGLTMVLACVAAFALLLPRKGRVNPLLRSNGAESVLMMGLLAVFVGGLALAAMGFPTGVSPVSGR